MNYNKKVGVMGGTFDPIHLGHLIVAEAAREHFSLDEILFVPTGNSYLKSDVLDSKTRIAMTGIAIEDNPYFAMSTIEVDRGGNSYSYKTLEYLREHNPQTAYYFIVGADSLFEMESWMHPDKIFSSCIVLVAVRAGHDTTQLEEKIQSLKETFGADIQLLPCRMVDISSTTIRERVRKHLSIRYMTHVKLIDYIKKNKIYQDMETDEN